nr:hypothetical protein [Kibdelosporangium sp. MJ126-NF4]
MVKDSRWVFETSGTPLPFEETENYTKRMIRDRFTADMLERYCQALGIDVFNLEAYGSDGVLVQSRVVIPPGNRKVWI